MTAPRPTTAPDGIERLRRAKKLLASFDAGVAATHGAFHVREVRVGAPPGLQGELPPQAAEAVGLAVRRLIEQQLDTVLSAARELLLAEVEAAKLAARDEYERELAAIH